MTEETRIKIIVERQPENVWLATSEDLPGFTVEIEDGVEIYSLARELAMEFMHMDGAIKPGVTVTFEFEARE